MFSRRILGGQPDGFKLKLGFQVIVHGSLTLLLMVSR